jgi:hypothetical protein
LDEGEMTEYVVRFLVGGAVVSVFAMLGIAIYRHGAGYSAVQDGSMMAGTVALAFYSVVVCHLLVRARLRALPATMALATQNLL